MIPRTLKGRLILAFILVCMISYSLTKGHAVAVHHLVLCSAFKGQILERGRPVTGVRIERSVSWNMEQFPRLDYTVTDENGEFQFSEVHGSAEFGLLAKWLHVPAIQHEINIVDPSPPIRIYNDSKQAYLSRTESEFGSRAIQFESNLENKKYVADQLWNVKPKPLNQTPTLEPK